MNAGFGRESALAHIRSVPVRRAIKTLVQRTRYVGQLLKRCFGDANFEATRKFRLELQRRNDGNEIGVSAPLSKPVERALDLARTGAHSGERIGYRLLRVIVRMDSHVVAGNYFHHFANDLFNLIRQRTAICVAKDDPAGTFFVSSLGASHGIFGIGLVAIEEMFAVQQHFLAPRFRSAHAVADRGQIFIVRRFESNLDVVVPRFCDKTDSVGLCIKKRGKAGIVGCRSSRPASHAERRKDRVEVASLAEQFGIGRIRARIATLDIIDAQLV